MVSREWDLLVCEVCGEAVTVSEFGNERDLWCNGSHSEKHKDTKMTVVRAREILTAAPSASATPGPASARPALAPLASVGS